MSNRQNGAVAEEVLEYGEYILLYAVIQVARRFIHDNDPSIVRKVADARSRNTHQLLLAVR